MKTTKVESMNKPGPGTYTVGSGGVYTNPPPLWGDSKKKANAKKPHRHDWGSIGQFTKRSQDQMTELKVSDVCWCFKCGAHKIGWDSNKVFLPSGKI